MARCVVVACAMLASSALASALSAQTRSHDSRSRRASRWRRTRCASAIRFASPSAFARRGARRSSFRARPIRHRRCSRSIPVVVRTSADTTAVEQYADYRVAAWDVGAQRVHLDDAIVHYNGAERRMPLSGDSVFVRSLLPADTAQRVAKPPRPLFELNLFPWWLSRAHRGGDHRARLVDLVVVPPPAASARRSWSIDPFEHAEAEFQRIEALGLLDAGERGRLRHAHDRSAARLSRGAIRAKRRCRSRALSSSARYAHIAVRAAGSA